MGQLLASILRRFSSSSAKTTSRSEISVILDVIEDVVMGHRPDCGR
jgi:hypothetical protein